MFPGPNKSLCVALKRIRLIGGTTCVQATLVGITKATPQEPTVESLHRGPRHEQISLKVLLIAVIDLDQVKNVVKDFQGLVCVLHCHPTRRLRF
jgi:hypothetical protein